MRAYRRVAVMTLAVALAVGTVGGWALRTILAPAPDVLEGPSYTLVTAEQGTVGRSLRLNVTSRWSPESVVLNRATGIVTGIALDSGAEVIAGEVLYTVDLRPVVVAEGEVPAFRELSAGAEGDDVVQLQKFLRTVGYRVDAVDGRFDNGLDSAVREWQRDLGVEDNGVVRWGDLVFVPELPARLAPEPELAVGAGLAGGEPALEVLSEEPVFSIALPESQTSLVSPGMMVEIPRDDGSSWSAEIVGIRNDEETSNRVAILAGVGGRSVCRDECDQIPVGQGALLPSLIHIVPEESGVTVPAAALVTTAGGETAVVLPSGDLRPVEVRASASGMAVVKGVEAGEQVRAPGEVPADDPDSR